MAKVSRDKIDLEKTTRDFLKNAEKSHEILALKMENAEGSGWMQEMDPCAFDLDPREITPAEDYLFVERDKPRAKVGAIDVPLDHVTPPRSGVVINVGPGRLLHDGTVSIPRYKVGDRVLFRSGAGSMNAQNFRKGNGPDSKQVSILVLRATEIFAYQRQEE